MEKCLDKFRGTLEARWMIDHEFPRVVASVLATGVLSEVQGSCLVLTCSSKTAAYKLERDIYPKIKSDDCLLDRRIKTIQINILDSPIKRELPTDLLLD